MSSRQIMITSGLLFTLLLTPAQSQQMDMEAMMRWASADVVRYHIVGVYQDQTYIAADGSGLGDVTDHVVIDLTWKLSESKLVGAPIIQNTKSTVTNLLDREPACLPPVLKGEYEHYDLQGRLDLDIHTEPHAWEIARHMAGWRQRPVRLARILP